jgi:sugar phosphate isomerase/epimerase
LFEIWEAGMRLSCGDHSFPLLPLGKAMDLISALEFDAFDLSVMGNRSQVRPEDIRDDIAGAAEQIGSLMSERNLDLLDVFVIPWTDVSVLSPNDPTARGREDARAIFTDMLELAVRLRSPGMTMLPGVEWDGIPHEVSLERAAEELEWRAQRARNEGLRFSVEAHIGSVCPTPEDALALLGMAPTLRLTLDYTHFVAKGIPSSRVEPLLPYAGHVHARGGCVGRGQIGMRDNTIDYERIIDGLSEANYAGAIEIEYVWTEWERMNECDNVSETILMRDRLRAKLAGEHWTYVPPPA